MVSLALVVVSVIVWDLDLALQLLISYLIFYGLVSLGLIDKLLLLKLKSTDIILADIISVSVASPYLHLFLLLYLSALAGFPVSIMFMAKLFINHMLAQANQLLVLIKLLALTVSACNYSYLRALYQFQSSSAIRLSNHRLSCNSLVLASISINQL
jgi:hypothetical protein